MQKFLTTIAISVTLMVPMFGANAGEACSKLGSSAPVPNHPTHVRNVVWRNMRATCKADAALSAQLQYKSYAFTFNVGDQPLMQLSVDVPANVRLSDAISVTNSVGEKIAATVAVKGQRTTIIFAQPVAPGSTLTVVKQAKAPKDVQSFDAALTGKTAGSATEVSLDTVKAQSNIN